MNAQYEPLKWLTFNADFNSSRSGAVPWQKWVDLNAGSDSGAAKPITVRALETLVAEVYAHKVHEDRADDAERRPRETITNFVPRYLKKKYGLMKLAEVHLRGIIKTMMDPRAVAASARVAVFGRLCAVWPAGTAAAERRRMLSTWSAAKCEVVTELIAQLYRLDHVREKLTKYVTVGGGDARTRQRQTTRRTSGGGGGGGGGGGDGAQQATRHCVVNVQHALAALGECGACFPLP